MSEKGFIFKYLQPGVAMGKKKKDHVMFILGPGK